MIHGVKRIFYISSVDKRCVLSPQAPQGHRDFWEQTTIASIASSRASFFFTYKQFLINHINKLKIALCCFGFGVFSFVKAFFLFCPIVWFLAKFFSWIIKKCSE